MVPLIKEAKGTSKKYQPRRRSRLESVCEPNSNRSKEATVYCFEIAHCVHSTLSHIWGRSKTFLDNVTGSTIFLGIVSLLWVLYRSGTKPSRLTYPCQKAAAAASYTFLIQPLVVLLCGLSPKLFPVSFSTVRGLKRRKTASVAILLSMSVLFSSIAVYVNLAADPFITIRERTSLTEGLTSVSIVRVKDNEIEEALEKAIDQIGGLDDIVPEGSKILIKPNLVQDKPPPTTTDPAVLEALIGILKRKNPKEILVADGSGGGNTTQIMASLGYPSIAERTEARLADLNYGDMVNVTVPNGGIVFDKFTFNRAIVEADVFISVACLKTHSQAVVTLGMKNLVGLGAGSVYGFPKAGLHDKAQEKGDLYMAGVIVDLCKVRRIDLVVIDGRVAMEGEGPADGTPVKLGLLIVGQDPVATDSVASLIMGFDPEKIPTLRLAQESGLGTNDLHKIAIRGEKIEDVFHPFIPAVNHETFQIFSASQLFVYNNKMIFVYVAIVSWISSITVVLMIGRRKPDHSW